MLEIRKLEVSYFTVAIVNIFVQKPKFLFVQLIFNLNSLYYTIYLFEALGETVTRAFQYILISYQKNLKG